MYMSLQVIQTYYLCLRYCLEGAWLRSHVNVYTGSTDWNELESTLCQENHFKKLRDLALDTSDGRERVHTAFQNDFLDIR